MQYIHNIKEPYPFLVRLKYDAELITKIKKDIPFTERIWEPERKLWLFTERGFDALVSIYTIHQTLQRKQVHIEKEQPETKIPTLKRTSSGAFDMSIAEKWFAPGYKPLQVQKKLLSEKRADGFGLWWECGLSKTAGAICEFLRRRHEGRAKRMFVIVWVGGLKFNWQEDLKKLFDIDIDIIDGELKNRATKIVESESLIAVTPFTTLAQADCIKAIADNFDFLVTDEIHKVVNDKRTTSIKVDGKVVGRKINTIGGLVRLCKLMPNRMALTGTPEPNKPTNSFFPLLVCNPEKFKSKYAFERRYAIYGGYQGRAIVGYKNLNELKSVLNTYGMRALKSEYLDIPPKTEQNVYYEISSKTEKILKLQVVISEEEFSKFNRMQLKDYYIKIHETFACPSMFADFASDKLKVVKDLVENDIPNDQKIIIFTSFKQAVKEIIDMLGKENCAKITGDETEKSVEIAKQEFKGNKRFMVATIQKMSVGFNLQHAQNIIMYDTAMTGADYEQGISRVWRTGQTNKAHIFNIISRTAFEMNRHSMIEEQREISRKLGDSRMNIESQITRKMLSEIVKPR